MQEKNSVFLMGVVTVLAVAFIALVIVCKIQANRPGDKLPRTESTELKEY